jgi:hypothetical protein
MYQMDIGIKRHLKEYQIQPAQPDIATAESMASQARLILTALSLAGGRHARTQEFMPTKYT